MTTTKADEFRAALQSTPRTPSIIQRHLDGMDPDLQETVLAALHDPSVSHARIAKALTVLGFESKRDNVRSWRERHVNVI